MLTPQDLQIVFGVEDRQHAIVLEAETKNPFPESVLRELRFRLITIDKHPFYNRDSFIVSVTRLLLLLLSSSLFFFFVTPV